MGATRPARAGTDAVVELSAAGPPSFDDFFTVEFPRMVVLATALTGDPAVAEELTQEALLRTYRHWPKVSSYDRPGAWTRRVTMNLASTARRRKHAEAEALERLAGLRPQRHDQELQLSAELWNAVRELPRRQRDAVTLFYLEDRSVAGVAAALGCSENTAKVHLFKGRRTLARLFDTGLGDDVAR